MFEHTRAGVTPAPLERPFPLDVAALRAYARAELRTAPYSPLRDVLAGVAQLRRNLGVLADQTEDQAEASPEGRLRTTALEHVAAARRHMARHILGDVATARDVSHKLAESVLVLADSLAALRAVHE